MPLVELVPFVIVGTYVLRAIRGREISTAGTVVTVAALTSVVAVVAGSLLPVTAVTELLRGLWVVPLIIGLELLAATRVEAVRKAADRRARMRDVLASVSNAAWPSGCTARRRW